MVQALWSFIIASVILFAFFFLRPPWSLENVVIGGVPLALLAIFACRFWQAKREQDAAPPEDEAEG
ncbi:MAG: hypothetical protein QM278_01050 [Pseudomonadota bacterium]|nr:hypothetical protein [Pseudomonadota bacterium]